MVSLPTFLAVAALMVPSQIEIVKFTADWCAPCRQLEPTLQHFSQQGYRLTPIDVDRQSDLARRYQVTSVPTLLLVADGKVVDRIVGVVSRAELATRLDRVAASAGATSPKPSSRRATAAEQRSFASKDRDKRTTQPRAPAQSNRRQAKTANAPSPKHAARSIEQVARRATVRLQVEDPRGHSYGSGTIVHVHGNDALILTCGHIFRDSEGQGTIHVELVGHQSRKPITGQLIRYDLERDLALVGIRTSAKLQPIPVAGPSFHVATGQRLFSVGCNRGRAPSVVPGHLKAVNKYLGPENLVVSGRPVDGRSGGGLFTYDGHLVGVCNAADPEIDEGLYAALASIHRHLDAAKLGFVYRQKTTRDDTSQLAAAPSGRSRPQPSATKRDRDQGVALAGHVSPANAETDRDWNRMTPRQRLAELIPETQSDARGLAAPAQGSEPEGAEVICIIRSKTDPGRPSEVLVLDRPSREFITTLTREHQQQEKRQVTQARRQLDTRRFKSAARRANENGRAAAIQAQGE